jgi:hypothetical protein
MVPDNLRWFKPGEFNNPELVSARAARYLDNIRSSFGKPIVVTDDARVPGQSLPTGASARSLHFLGQAFDIRIRDWSREDLWDFVRAVMTMATAMPADESGVELELVWSSTDKHAHVGFFFDGRPSRLLIRGE